VRGRRHTPTISYPLQRHRGLAPLTRGEANLLRITVAAALEIRRGPAQSVQILLGNPLGLRPSRLPYFLPTVLRSRPLADLCQQFLTKLLTPQAPPPLHRCSGLMANLELCAFITSPNQ
jgi:hypothetical protein